MEDEDGFTNWTSEFFREKFESTDSNKAQWTGEMRWGWGSNMAQLYLDMNVVNYKEKIIEGGVYYTA